ncbi:Putative cutinase/acetylxylan esterase, alpha/Beta hydrolase [Septoria linicola]|uniref:Cutinase/acetylxylan esterase, alpha/Beta hydrolase n=1 Tax=Septoria linicola TaxID=215465 RepID=A0A9Q9APX3_9PEZI|nr:putative cutinase/acetylxylan esterase, alpha/Beta hydrolase [Septoria linicola]USW52910.1 Putative cutinase/acetylxylan esterase, alpha/Beta hydrolase [Septoria linicola]
MPTHRNALLAAGLSMTAALTQAQTFGDYSTISNVSTSACPGEGGAHIIVARASVEPLGYGIIGNVKDAVLNASEASNAEYVVYPATLTDYFNSESAGVLGMRALAEAFVAQDCPGNAPIVLMGYSQGAQVVSDYLSGQNVERFPYNESLSQPASKLVISRVAAIITMGDPSINITDNSAHVGNSTKSGLFARFENSSMVFETTGLDSRFQAYCDELDPYCASAGNFDNISVHLRYVQEYGMQAAEYVEMKIKEYYAKSTTGGSNSTSGGENATMTGSGMPAISTGGAGSLAEMRVGGTAAAVLGLGLAFFCGL